MGRHPFHIPCLAATLLAYQFQISPVRFLNSGMTCPKKNEDQSQNLVWDLAPVVKGVSKGRPEPFAW